MLVNRSINHCEKYVMFPSKKRLGYRRTVNTLAFIVVRKEMSHDMCTLSRSIRPQLLYDS